MTAPLRLSFLIDARSKAICVWCLEARAERDSAADCLVLRICKNVCTLDAAILVPHFGRALLWRAHHGDRRVLGA
jgi:hypothetical protein